MPRHHAHRKSAKVATRIWHSYETLWGLRSARGQVTYRRNTDRGKPKSLAPFSDLFRRDFEKSPGALKRQLLYSPRGWGRCVFPVFSSNDKDVDGCGTGFFIKGTDLGITAEHLLDVGRIELEMSGSGDDRVLDLSGLPYGLTTLLPSQAVIFGTCRIPSEYCQTVRRFLFDLALRDDPLAEIRGRRRYARRSDVMLLDFFDGAALPPAAWRPRTSARIPRPGDWVCAVGFPGIQVVHTAAKDLDLLVQEEGMAIAFAKVTDVVMIGRGSHETCPIALVDSDWPGGMSGGPVFNDAGRVIGVVSRELVGSSKTNCGTFSLLHHALSGF